MTSCEGSLPPGDIPGRDDNNHSHTGNVPAVSCESDETHAAGSLGERTAPENDSSARPSLSTRLHSAPLHSRRCNSLEEGGGNSRREEEEENETRKTTDKYSKVRGRGTLPLKNDRHTDQYPQGAQK